MWKNIWKKFMGKANSGNHKSKNGKKGQSAEENPPSDVARVTYALGEDEDVKGDEFEPAVSSEEMKKKYISQRKPRYSVSAEAFGAWNKREKFDPPVYKKTEEEKERIKLSISKGFMFNCLDENDLETVIDAFVEKKVSEGETIIHQGEDGECLYLIEDGSFDVFKKTNNENKHVCVMTVGESVGELALLYNCPRAATVTAKMNSIVWVLDRESFNHIVRDAAVRKRELHENFLSEVELLKDMDPYERSKMADALKEKKFEAGQFIIKQGETGDEFYIIESGGAKAIKDGKVVMNYGRGDYFGELALLHDQPRAASIQAKEKVSCLCFDRNSFQRLFGPLDTILRRNFDRYKTLKLHTEEFEDIEQEIEETQTENLEKKESIEIKSEKIESSEKKTEENSEKQPETEAVQLPAENKMTDQSVVSEE